MTKPEHKYTINDLKRVRRLYDENWKPLINSAGTRKQVKYIKEEKRLNDLENNIFRQQGAFLSHKYSDDDIKSAYPQRLKLALAIRSGRRI